MISRIIAFVAISTCVLASNAYARQWYVEPAVFLSPGYEDNPFLLTDAESEEIEGVSVDGVSVDNENPGSQYLTFFGGNFRLGSETETDLIAFDAIGSARRYDDSILDTEDLLGRFVYQKTGEKHDWGIETGYQQTSSISSFFGGPAGGVTIDEFGRFRDDVDTQVLFFTPKFSSRFSSNWLGELEFGYRDVSFSEPVDTSTDYEDFRTTAELRRVVSERVSLIGILSILFYRPNETVDLFQTEKENAGDLYLGVDYNISERFSALFSAGPGYVNSFVSNPGGTVEIDDTSPNYNASLLYEGLRNNFSITGFSVYESYLDSGVSKSERISALYSRPQTLGGELGFAAFYLKRDPALGELFENTYIGVGPRFTLDINRAFSVSIIADYRKQERVDIITGESENVDSTAVNVIARYDWGRKLIKQ